MKKIVLVLVVMITLIGGLFWFQKEKQTENLVTTENQDLQSEQSQAENESQDNFLKPSPDYSIHPDFSKVKDFNKTLQLQRGVSVKYGDGWIGETGINQDDIVDGSLAKMVNGRAYLINFAEIEYPLPTGKVDNTNLKIYTEIQINGKPHVIVVSHSVSSGNAFDFAYLSSCSMVKGNACPIQLGKTNLLVMLKQNVPNAQEPTGLDFSRKDDQQILAEFTEIASTLKY